jgi:hypothetical protein
MSGGLYQVNEHSSELRDTPRRRTAPAAARKIESGEALFRLVRVMHESPEQTNGAGNSRRDDFATRRLGAATAPEKRYEVFHISGRGRGQGRLARHSPL